MRYHIKGTKGRLKDVKSEHCQKIIRKLQYAIDEMVIYFREYLAFSDNVCAHTYTKKDTLRAQKISTPSMLKTFSRKGGKHV